MPEENAELFRQVLARGRGPLADVVALNAGAAIYVGGRAADLESGASAAREAMTSGAAARKLEQLKDFRLS